jgi:murein DD-endopeptidase MepM/ murein hydrolase activator NlpD
MPARHHPSRPGSLLLRGRRAAAGVAALLLFSAAAGPLADAAPSQSAGSDTADEQARRDEIRERQAALAAELEPLTATDAELEAAVATLQQKVDAQSAVHNDAARAAEDARAYADQLADEQDAVEAESEALQVQVRDRAVDRYINPDSRGDTTALVLGAEDLGEGERRRALLDAVTGNDEDVLDQLRAADARLESLRAEAAQAVTDAEALEAEAAAALAELEADEADLARQEAALQERIDEFRAEVDALDAEDDALRAIIADWEAQQAARAEAERQAQAEAQARTRAQSPSTTAAPSGGGTAAGTTPTTATAPPTTAPRPPSSSGMIWPTAGSVTSEYGPRWGRMHQGIDISAPTGTPIYAAMAGTVIFVGVQSGYGNIVIVDHGGGLTTAYAHQSQMASSVGQRVAQGELIGYVGSTGRSTGPHLHFETRVNGSAQNPRNYLP